MFLIAPGHPALMDDEYVRKGVAQIFMEVEPLAGRQHVAITERRTMKDWALQIREMLDELIPRCGQGALGYGQSQYPQYGLTVGDV
jgi:hypothetical protein